MKILFTARSRNAKTGDVPTAWIGATLEESRRSCKGCEQLDRGTCYAQFGQVAVGMRSIERSATAKPAAHYTIRRALAARHKSARMVRFSALGDCARADRRQLQRAFAATKRAGLAIVGYTHFWQDHPEIRGQLMASCDDFTAARAANAAGWRAAIIAPAGTTGTITIDGVRAIECPAVAATRHGKKYTCNDCAAGKRGALCDASTDAPNVYFAEHGQAVARQQRRHLTVLL